MHYQISEQHLNPLQHNLHDINKDGETIIYEGVSQV